ncbi:NAD(P)/FAD-dependent oxidoreductase [Granulosicoccus antarcticus]|uniref:Gamma-glutamylputrescine oxidoreductase n=1 Tax=Granulosicoccus antarcticus IMCC3135 TaxID=1192854 RepID=A0A2Z2NW18_9GAMM|nr:FAD-binding oxidoreductase [Granulosicoccus antarcticus]ASJ71877.1 Gamma-glutamylputrescine oxidoreductase [Granulosicoccus antarcticus IMCC3135]
MTEPYCNSYYAASANQTAAFPMLDGDIDVDVAIIGGGFTGIASALELSERGFRVAVLEANQIGWGATGRNGGQVTGSLSGDKAMEREFRKTLGAEASNYVWNLRWRGHDIIEDRVKKYGIQCDLKHGHMLTAYKPSHIPALKAMYHEACENGMEDQVELIEGADVKDYLESDLYPAGLLNNKNMHLHSLNLCLGEADAVRSLGGQIFCSSRVTEIVHGKRPIVKTQHGQVTADTVLLAGNAYHQLAQGSMKGVLFPASLGIMATEPLSEEVANKINPHDIAVYDCRMVLDYFRLTADKRLIFGGGTKYSGGGYNTTAVENELRPALERTFPRLKGVKIDYQWSGQAGIIINRIPHIGKIAPNVFFAEGYSGHGMATSHIVAEIMANTITGSLEEFDIFANVPHTKLPFGKWFGNAAISLGMWYYVQLEKLK